MLGGIYGWCVVHSKGSIWVSGPCNEEAEGWAYLMRSMCRGTYYMEGRRIGAVDPTIQQEGR
jgi:hypothetical protein